MSALSGSRGGDAGGSAYGSLELDIYVYLLPVNYLYMLHCITYIDIDDNCFFIYYLISRGIYTSKSYKHIQYYQ